METVIYLAHNWYYISKDVEYFNKIFNQLDLKDIYRVFHPAKANYKLSQVQMEHPINYMPGHKANNSKLLNHLGKSGENVNIWKLSNTFINNP